MLQQGDGGQGPGAPGGDDRQHVLGPGGPPAGQRLGGPRLGGESSYKQGLSCRLRESGIVNDKGLWLFEHH